MKFKITDAYCIEEYVTIESDLLNDKLRIHTYEDEYYNSIIVITREESIMMAEKILEFWKENPKYKF